MSDSSTGQVLGATTTVAGVATLPNTAGDTLLTVLSIVLIVGGLLVTGSFVASRVAGKILR